MSRTAKGEYGLGELYEKHDSWYGRWRSPGGAKRNRKVGRKKATGVPGLTRTEARARLRQMMEEDGATTSHAPEEVPILVALTERSPTGSLCGAGRRRMSRTSALTPAPSSSRSSKTSGSTP